MSDMSYVRSEMLPERAPPASSVGFVGWMRQNLFNGIVNSILTIVSLVLIAMVAMAIVPWIFSPTWNGTSQNDCREIIGAGHHAACWGVINDRWEQLLFGFYPNGTEGDTTDQRWRPIVAFALLFVAVTPVLFSMISRRMNWVLLLAVLGLTGLYLGGAAGMILGLALLAGAAFVGFKALSTDKDARAAEIEAGAKRLPNPLIFSAIFPFIAPWLLWGGSIWLPVGAALGFVIGYFAYSILSKIVGSLAGIILAVVASIVWWLFLTGGFASLMDAILPIGLEPVESRKFGGFMLSITIGVVAIACSLPIGIVLALGRQSDLMIVKALCVGFIEFIRGVPLITLLFVASTLLNIFMPPGTNFDIILRVLIMVTLFASAYMAEVIRGGLAALPRGQYEAADALGLDYWKAQRLIIMPQALKISIPGIVSTFIGVFKDTVLVSIIGLLDPLGLSNAIRADQAWNGLVWELYGFIALLFFVFCFSMSRYSMYLERRLRTDHR
ncbi:amino acid ABC transporter permease [Aliiroseovarius sp. F20344]|uniref:amino acid ABC transporter permease n=1 Tax=Aliiroseovarius sp. F20344 TaxID=2926414 RepID=UPI001FF6EA98|nr:amino acid ABC transporter permease [Aliiroseovarius sp. F20344]MCK0142600.1 amino acid ABC transporter permease [Aliiroseovarius sp. F20344]